MKFKTLSIKHLKSGFAVLSVILLIILLTACPHSLSYSDILNGPDGQLLSLEPSTAQIVQTNSIDFEVSGGVPPYIMTLNTTLGGTGELLENHIYTAPEDAEGIVLVRVEDSYGSIKEATITVESLTLPPLIISPSYKTIYLNQTISFESSGGSGEYSYDLKEPVGISEDSGESLLNNIYHPPFSVGGTAIIEVSDGEGNTNEATIIVLDSVLIPLTVSLSEDDVFKGEEVEILASGGIGDYSYTLKKSIGENGESLTDNLYHAPHSFTGIALVEVSDEGGNVVQVKITVQ